MDRDRYEKGVKRLQQMNDMSTIGSRLTALSEVCCGDQRQKVWTSFVQRAARQRDAGSEFIW